MYLGIKADKSLPAETEFAAMFTPSCARANARAMKNTPQRVAEFGFPSRNLPSRSKGFFNQICFWWTLYPDRFSVDDFGGTGDNNADEGGQSKSNRDSKELRP